MIAHEINSLVADGWDWHDACRHVAKQYSISVDDAVKEYVKEFGVHPSEFSDRSDD